MRFVLRTGHSESLRRTDGVGGDEADRIGISHRCQSLIRNILTELLGNGVGPDPSTDRRSDSRGEVVDSEVSSGDSSRFYAHKSDLVSTKGERRRTIVSRSRLDGSLHWERDHAGSYSSNRLHDGQFSLRVGGRSELYHKAETQHFETESGDDDWLKSSSVSCEESSQEGGDQTRKTRNGAEPSR